MMEEKMQQVDCMDLPLDWNNVTDLSADTQEIHVESISDALIICLTNLGKVDIEYISSITGESYKDVIFALRGSIFQNPLTWDECYYKGWETSEEYLSGNIKKKYDEARKANRKYNGYFKDSVEALEKVMPPEISRAQDIYITLGSPWVPSEIIDDFIMYLFGDPYADIKDWNYYGNSSYKSYKAELMAKIATIHDEVIGAWEIQNKGRYFHSIAVTETYGTKRMEALYILEKTLNMKSIVVTDEIDIGAKKKKRVINKAETLAAVEKQQKLIKTFQDWVWKDYNRKTKLKQIFEEKYGYIRKRMFDGSFLTFPTMNPNIKLYPYQKNAIARILFTPNTLLAHDVGAGKTYIMIAAGQELRRMNLSKKNMYVVPNNIVGQWKEIFLQMYPNAKLLCIEPKDFTPNKRQGALKSIRDDNFDGVIIAYSCFEQIPISKSTYLKQVKEEKEKLLDLMHKKEKVTHQLSKKCRDIEKVEKILETEYCDPNMVFFDNLGITRLFVDEAHNFKNVPIETRTSSILGINRDGSKKCQEMMDKVHLIQRNNDGKGVVFATGTPITNSITDAFIMQQYLQSGELEMLDLQCFDSWIGMFAEKNTEFEIDVDTSSYRLATRFSKFHNLPELTSLLASVADFHKVDNSNEIPNHDGYVDVLLPKTKELTDYLETISNRADDIRQRRIGRTDDNMLKITTDGRKAALDLRLVNKDIKDITKTKVSYCANNVAEIYFNTQENRSTQLVFCDTSVPKLAFNIYDELKKVLIEKGVPSNQIAFIHSATTDKKREELFSKIRNGEIRILIGSTFKMGLGVNIQNKLIALHHVDIPWRPADMVQREGRILRQGNTNKEVKLFRYITEGSFDAYSWQLLETKQKFISNLLSGSITERSGGDIDDAVLDYAEVKALAIGNPEIKERVEVANELSRYLSLQHKLVESRINLEKELLELRGKIARQHELANKCKVDVLDNNKYIANNLPISLEERKEIRKYLDDEIKSYIFKPEEKKLISYRGFDIILPKNMGKENLFVWLTRTGRYYVELGSSDKGNLVRIDNFIDDFQKHYEKLNATLSSLLGRRKDIKEELAKDESYIDEIARCRTKLAEIDSKLGAA